MADFLGPMVGGLVGGIGSVIGGAMGAAEMAEARRQALDLINQTVTEYQNIGLPPEQALAISLERYKQAGILDPELENLINQNPTEYLNIATDPRLRNAELDALSQLKEIGLSGGMRDADKAEAERIFADIAQRDRGNREAIAQNRMERNVYGSGDEYAAQLANAQNSATNMYNAGLDLAGKAQNNAFRAIAESGDLASRLQGKDFEQSAQIAQAQDTINAMNTQASRAMQQRNVASRNAAQEQNLRNLQDLWNANTDISNKQEAYNKNLPQQMFENAMARQSGIANARSGQANNIIKAGEATGQLWGGMGSALQKAGTGFGNYFANNSSQVRNQITDEDDVRGIKKG